MTTQNTQTPLSSESPTIIEQDVKIECTGHGRGRIWINGVELKRVRKVSFSSEADDINTVAIELIPTTVDITTMADVSKKYAAVGGE